MVFFVFIMGIFELSRNFGASRHFFVMLDEIAISPGTGGNLAKKHAKTTVAYAVSVTHFEEKENKDSNLIDRAAVLHQSIKLAMQLSLRYDYHIYAFVHPEAIDAKDSLERLGYRVLVRDTPFNITAVPNFDLVDAQRIGCCGDREYLKLHSYLLLEYPVVVHLDLDTIVLKPMDEVFDFMALSMTKPTKLSVDQVKSFARTSTMWMNKSYNVSLSHSPKTILENPRLVNFMFTRDYNMVDFFIPPHRVGVQGGFLVIRPNQRDFDRMVEILQSGGGFHESKWGYDKLGDDGYGGYYGAGTIQGLASYYYDHYENATRSIELNRCNYNNMVDKPTYPDKKLEKEICTTTEEECEDCRKTMLEDIYTTHFTGCGKPEWCFMPEEKLCRTLLTEWHKIRLSLEVEWIKRFSSSAAPYIPELKGVDLTNSRKPGPDSGYMGHCHLNEYIPLRLPVTTDTAEALI